MSQHKVFKLDGKWMTEQPILGIRAGREFWLSETDYWDNHHGKSLAFDMHGTLHRMQDGHSIRTVTEQSLTAQAVKAIQDIGGVVMVELECYIEYDKFIKEIESACKGD